MNILIKQILFLITGILLATLVSCGFQDKSDNKLVRLSTTFSYETAVPRDDLEIAGLKTDEEYWADTGIRYKSVQDLFNSNDCFKSRLAYVACMHTVNGFLAFHEPALMVFPKALIETTEGVNLKDVKKDFKHFVFMTGPKIEGDNIVEIFKKSKSLRKRINNEWERVYDQSKIQPFNLEEAELWLRRNIIDKNSHKEAMISANAMNSFFTVVFGPHNYLAPKAKFDDLGKNDAESFVGVGVIIVKSGELVVVRSVIENGPAYKAGIRANDVIEYIGSTAIKGKDLKEVVKLLKGPENTKVYVTIRRNDGVIKKPFIIVRAKIVIKNVVAKIINDNDKKYGYLELDSFMPNNSCDKLEEEIDNFKSEQVDGIIFDLRNNGGGRLSLAICISNLFIDKYKRVVSVMNLSDNKWKHTYTKNNVKTKLPLVTLINAGSASASEIVSGALQDHQRGFIVGVRSYGKGTVQMGFYSKYEGVLFFRTIQRFYMPSGRTNQIEGIVPDFEVYSKPDPSEIDKFRIREEDNYLYALPHVGKKYVQARPQVIKSIETCIKEKGKAKSKFKKILGADYQLLYAQDVLRCYEK